LETRNDDGGLLGANRNLGR